MRSTKRSLSGGKDTSKRDSKQSPDVGTSGGDKLPPRNDVGAASVRRKDLLFSPADSIWRPIGRRQARESPKLGDSE